MGEMERYLFHRGEYRAAYEYFGAHPTRSSTIFRVWAPMAKSVAVVGDFNEWSPREQDYLQKLNNEGVWEVEIPLPKSLKLPSIRASTTLFKPDTLLYGNLGS